MSTILRRSSRRYWVRHPLQALLAVAGIAVGVAVTLAIDLANGSAEKAFRLSTAAVTGKATHQVVSGPGGLPEEIFPRIVLEGTTAPAAPVVEETVMLSSGVSRSLRLLGLDPTAEAPFRTSFDGIGGGIDLGALATEPGAVLATRETARDLGLAVGDQLGLRIGGVERSVTLVGELPVPDRRRRLALQDVLVADLSTAQEVLGWKGRLSRIDLLLPRGAAGEAAEGRIRRLLPESAEILTAAGRAETITGMTAAFQLNLRALSLLALVCGAFLVFNTCRFSVVQRRPLLGRLRALGVTGREVFGLVLREAAAFGLVGSLLGSALGVGLATILVRLVTRTINDLYFSVAVRHLDLRPGALLAAVAMGVAASLLASFFPAREAARASPRVTLSRSRLESSSRFRAPRLALGGVGCFAVGALALVPERALALNFFGVLAVLLGFAALTPWTTLVFMALLQRPARRIFGTLGSMAVRGVTASLSRTGVAIAALALAVAVTVGIGSMIDSFRRSVTDWLSYTLSADLYLSPARLSTDRHAAPFGPSLLEDLGRLDGVSGWNTIRRAEIETDGASLRIAAMDLHPRAEAAYSLITTVGGEAWRQWRAEDAVFVSEPFAYRRGVAAGDVLRLPARTGDRQLVVAGVFRDYGSDQGMVMIRRSLYDGLWNDPGYDALSVYLEPGKDLREALRQAREMAAAYPGLVVRSNRQLRAYSLEIFDRTFLITGVLRLLAGGVAFLGVLGALAALQLERRRELGVLRATGLTPRQVWRLVVAQTGLMGLVAGLLSLPLGLTLAWIMVEIINRRSFGWTLDWTISPAILLEALALALAAAVLAGLFPARRMAATSPTRALRGDSEP